MRNWPTQTLHPPSLLTHSLTSLNSTHPNLTTTLKTMHQSPYSRFDEARQCILAIVSRASPFTVGERLARETILAKCFTPNQFEECLEEYERLNIWQINQSRTRITCAAPQVCMHAPGTD